MILEKYKDSKIAILGYGVEGRSTFEYFAKDDLDVVVFDQRSAADLISAYPELRGASIISGVDCFAKLIGFDVVFRSPGISPLTPEIIKAVDSGSVLTSQTEEFMQYCPCPVIGVTGTKGKGTTSTLITEILKSGGERVYLGGNIGVPALTFLDELTRDSVVVLELSSFQLQTLKKSPQIAVLLNTTSEHLDYHKNTDEYRDAKANILKYQNVDDFALINADYEVPKVMSESILAKKLYFSRNHAVEGCYVNEKDQIELGYDKVSSIIADAKDMQLRGRHNLENITAASLAASVCGINDKVISDTIKKFVGLEHRLEFVDEINGVKYYNDSFSTIPETVIAALDSFTEPAVLIAGGSSKNSDYSDLGEKLSSSSLRALVLIGETASEIKAAISGGVSYPIIDGGRTMQEIVIAAASFAKAGDVVLLSPACASKDMFENYKDRGNQFKKAARSLKFRE